MFKRLLLLTVVLALLVGMGLAASLVGRGPV